MFINVNVVILLFCFFTSKAFKAKINCLKGQIVCYPKPRMQGNFYSFIHLVDFSKSFSPSLPFFLPTSCPSGVGVVGGGGDGDSGGIGGIGGSGGSGSVIH